MLVIEGEIDTYSITVQSEEHCHYSIMVISDDTKFTRLKLGLPHYYTLLQN